jgi:hypothetical protein
MKAVPRVTVKLADLVVQRPSESNNDSVSERLSGPGHLQGWGASRKMVRGLAQPGSNSGAVPARRRVRRGSDKRSSRSKPDMDTDREKSTAEKKFFQEQKPAHRGVLKILRNRNAHLYD